VPSATELRQSGVERLLVVEESATHPALVEFARKRESVGVAWASSEPGRRHVHVQVHTIQRAPLEASGPREALRNEVAALDGGAHCREVERPPEHDVAIDEHDRPVEW
jgi:hypothetical protein